MKDLNDSKSNSSEHYTRPNRFSAVSHFLIGCGVFVMCAGIFAIAGAMLAGISFEEIMSGVDVLNRIEDNPLLLKVFVFFSSSLPLIIAAVLVAFIIRANPKDYLLLRAPLNHTWFGLSIVFVFISIPLMGPLLELNSLVDFSAISEELNTWLKNQETANNTAYEAMIGDKTTVSFLSSILFMAFLPALAEELFFRGFLMNVLNGVFKNMHVAILITAVIFSFIHMQFLKALPMFFLALVFGYAVYWTRSIWTSVLAHFINNSLAVTQLYFFTDGNYDEALSLENTIPVYVSIVLAVVVVALFIYIQKNSNTKTENFYV
ncbi:MAG: CPBP family intramembrane metalloprotease [Bacteroidia bacterium]|nr:CPBP family intramembrane metalloprotease [Bacteroidia bacterium]NNJ55574.1 CPBP family intramembrane metalloprotease [Bacteroidia bacterium]